MDSGSYNNVRRGAMPPSSGTPASYKANVNRTKTRKWVEAKVQNYDGDDWGNDYDDYDDGDDQHDPEPEPVPPPAARPTGPRQLGPSGYQLPSSRTFPHPAVASLPSNANPRVFGPSTLRNPSGPPSLHVQTQQAPPAATSPPYAIESAYPTTTSSHANAPIGPYSAGPAPTPSRFPPRKSSLSQQDRPEINDKTVSKPDSRPGSSSANRPWVDQRSASPSGGLLVAKTAPIVRPADIYKRVGEEKEKERLSMESGRPSLDSLPGRADGTSSPGQFRSSGEQRRRTSFESHDGSESARAPKSTLAPVAERRSEYGMDGFLGRASAGQSPGPAASTPELSQPQNGPSDEVKADLLKSRRFSTSPQLPILTRVSGFGDDFFSGSNSFSSQFSPKLSSPSEESRSLQNEINAPQRALEEAIAKPSPMPAANEKSEVMKEGALETTQPQLGTTRPQLPGAWVSESLTVSVPSEQPTPMEKEGTRSAHPQSGGVSPTKEIGSEPSYIHPATDYSGLSSTETPQYTLNTNGANRIITEELASAAGQHSDAINPEALPIGEHHPTPRSLSPLKTETSPTQSWSRPTSTVLPAAEDKSLQNLTSSTAQLTIAPVANLEFSPTAPLNPNRAQPGQPDIILPSTQLRKSTISTIETASPEKESDKLREEIIKSLSTTPVSPGSSGMAGRDGFDAEPAPGDLARESTYLAGVYDDYLSLGEEKSLQELSQAAKASTPTIMSQSVEGEHRSTPEPRDMPVAQPAPLNSSKSPPPQNTTRARRFSWQQEPEEVNMSPVETVPAASTFPQDSSAHSEGATNTESNAKTNVVAPVSDSLQAMTGATGSISHQVSDVSSRGPEDASLAAIESPSPISFVATRALKPATEEQNVARLSLADEKEKALIGDAQSTRSSVSQQHPALTQPPEQEDEGPSPESPEVVAPDVAPTEPWSAPTPFREILNLATYDQRVQKFDETREHFYVMDSGLSNWLTYLQSQPEHVDAVASYNTSVGTYNASSLLSKVGAQTVSGASGASQPSHKTGTAASHPRRSSISNMQQLIAGSSSGFGASGAQVGTKSKELLHAAGAFGNKGMKSGMKLFNKGKNKLRERAAGDKAFF